MDEVRLSLSETGVVRWAEGAPPEEKEIFLPVEEPLAIEVDGYRAAVLMRLPGAEKELAVGFCVSEGIVGSFGEIALVHHCGGSGLEGIESRNVVRVRTTRGEGARPPDDLPMLLIRSGCGRSELGELGAALPKVSSDLTLSARVLGQMAARLCRAGELRSLCGGVHCAALFDREGRIVASFEDVGRHNAMDKAAGYALIRGISLEDKVMLTTGRASYEMVTKAARIGLPVLVSLSSPTSLSVDYARSCGVTLAGYARKHRLIIYTHPERIRDLTDNVVPAD